MDCDDATLLLVAGEARTLTAVEATALHQHADGCDECRALLADNADARLRSIVQIPEDALDDLDLLVLPQVDPSVFATDAELARGGMGRIVRARDRRLGRDVAIKEVIAPSMRARFEREAMITAQLQHPAIIPIYEAGTWPNGSAFYTMRLVSGGTLGDAIAKTRTLAERIALLPHVVALTDALAYAHSRRIVHRDLKPTNVLVGEFGETVVIDWGLAKQLDRDVGDGATAAAPPARPSIDLTIAGSVLGTPGFMAPEQAAGEHVDERGDVFALGAILYNLLAGHGPYLDRHVDTAKELIELARQGPPTPLAELVPSAPRDLCAIVDRAMSRARDARYRTAKDMADELHRFQAGQLLRSREYGARELIARWARRHRAAVSVAAIALVVVAAGTIASVREIVRRRDAAVHALALGQLEQGRQLLVAGDPGQAVPYLAAAVAELHDDAVARQLATIALRDVDRRIAAFHGSAAAFAPGRRTLAVGHDDGSIDLVDAVTGDVQRTLPAVGGKITRVDYARAGAAIVTASPNGAYVRDLAGAATVIASGDVTDARVAGELVVLADARGVRTVKLDGTPVATAVHAGAGGLDVSADGRTLLALGSDHVGVWTLPELAPVVELPAMWYGRLDRDGSAVLGNQEHLVRFAPRPGAPLVVLHRGEAQPIARVAGGALASANLLVGATAETTRAYASEAMITAVAGVDVTHLVTGGYDGVVRVWDVERSARPIIVLDAEEATAELIVDATGTRALSIGRRGTLELWDVSPAKSHAIVARLGHEIGSLVARGGVLASWLGDTPTDPIAIVDGGRTVGAVSGWIVGITGDELLVSDGDGRVVGYALRDAARRRVIADAAWIHPATLSPNGAVLATCAGGRVTLRDARSGATSASFEIGARDITALAVDDDARHVVTGHDDGTVRIWDVRSGAATATLLAHAGHVADVVIRGDRLFTASWDRTVRGWAFPSGAARGVVLSSVPGATAWSPNGRLLATVERTPLVDLWDSARGVLLERIPTSEAMTSIEFVDDDHLVAGGVTGTIERLDIRERARDDDDIARLARASRWQLVDGRAIDRRRALPGARAPAR